jgi:transcriptional regulator with PAS, ATPase and Fis domain
LNKEIANGHFRQDLFYRLSVFQIALPSLRERVGDIEQLAMHFVDLYCTKTNQPVKVISKEYLEALKRHSWPGNIRELKNVIERSVIIESEPVLALKSLPIEMQFVTSEVPGKQLSAFSLASAEKLHIQKMLNYTGGNKAETARLLNIGVTTLYRKIDEYKLG